MPSPSSFDFTFGRSGAPREPDAPMRLLLIGDFSGRPSLERPPLADRPTLRVDIDNFDTVLSRLSPRVNTPAGAFTVGSLDDLHPDALFAKLELFAALRDARSRPAPKDDGSTFAALLGGKSTPATTAPPKSGDALGLDALLQRVVAPHVVPNPSSTAKAYADAIDSSIAAQMRGVLHDPAFQSVEAAWRGVHWLVSRLELAENLQLHLFDVSREELEADARTAADGDVTRTALHRALAGRRRASAGEAAWSAIASLHSFGNSGPDVGVLAVLGAVASHAGGPLLAGAQARAWLDAGDDPLTAWNALRTSGAARWIGLVGPRMLLRRPYGKRSEPVEAFAFEELGNQPTHEEYLWGSGALAAAVLLGRGYQQAEGWSFSPGDEREVDDLPSITRVGDDGESELVPCAEYFLADRDADELLAAGLMPLLSHRHSNVAMLMRFQSIAKPGAPLEGLPA